MSSFLIPQRLVLAARAEYLLWGRVSSKTLKGTSGVALKVVEVTLFLEMKVVPTSWTMIPEPRSMIVRSGNASPPWETKYAGPSRGVRSSGVETLACPTTEAAGQLVGFVSNV